MAQKKIRQRQLALWIFVNLIIFIACYLNYRLQLKHRYLYRLLNAGLCISRAAAMVINFNLILVWLPMCKYSLTRLACLAIGTLRHYRRRLTLLTRSKSGSKHQQQQQQQVVVVSKFQQQAVNQSPTAGGEMEEESFPSSPNKLLYIKLIKSAQGAWLKLNVWFLTARINSLSSFLTAVDHCKSLHTICATTITIASVIHTVAHLINVINFSRNYDPLMSNLNMAEHRGQNPFQLLISVPGVTGSLMIIILILMSLSSVDIIRNSSYDLFQIFHRLSIVFVILLLLHPSSHVLKEQSNVDRHHPDICYNQTTTNRLNSTSPVPVLAEQRHASNLDRLRRDIVKNSTRTIDLKNTPGSSQNNTTAYQEISDLGSLVNTYIEKETIDEPEFIFSRVGNDTSIASHQSRRRCLDSLPLFVAQSSICWYVLGIGLSCYLFDLLLRKWRRSKNSIDLLDIRLDCEGNLIELILSNNHKRFNYWLPGQFVYLNCPQIAAYEWHPFTISSMNNESGHFTLHIKTGGDWTRKLREKLEYMRVSMSFLKQNLNISTAATGAQQLQQLCPINLDKTTTTATNLQLDPPLPSSNLDCCGNKTGPLQIECNKMIRVKYEYEQKEEDFTSIQPQSSCSESYRLQQATATAGKGYDNESNNELYSISCKTSEKLRDIKLMLDSGLDLYIDGPFHSPFDRLLEQQVSVCVANGVGWTAFSSIFQCITNNFVCSSTPDESTKSDCWWNKWRNFVVDPRVRGKSSVACDKADISTNVGQLPETKLHLMVIVTSIEQMKPFYYLALNYFKQIQDECHIEIGNHLNPVREITAFITRCSQDDETVKQFCRQENLSWIYGNHPIRINDLFTMHFGKPKFDAYLSEFDLIYPDSKKISVYCCGSMQVKSDIREICRSLNKMDKHCPATHQNRSRFSYHEENF